MKETRLWVAVFVSFLLLEISGLMLGMRLVNSGIIQPETEATAGIGIFLYLLLATGVLILIIRFFKPFLKVLEILAIFISTEIFFEIILLDTPAPAIPASILALLIVYLRFVFPDDILTQNLAIITSVLGIGAMIGASFGLVACWILMLLLAVYDIIAVFKTKHMVYIAKEVIKQKLAFTFVIPTKDRIMQLGGGDLVMPIIVSTAIFREYGIASALISLIFGLVGLIALLVWLAGKPGKAMPALPPIALGMMMGFVLSLVLGGL